MATTAKKVEDQTSLTVHHLYLSLDNFLESNLLNVRCPLVHRLAVEEVEEEASLERKEMISFRKRHQNLQLADCRSSCSELTVDCMCIGGSGSEASLIGEAVTS